MRSHQALLSDLYSASFLEALPAGLRRLDDNAGGDRMVEGPDGLEGVFVRCLGEGWDNEDDGGGGEGEGDGTEAMFKTGLRMRRGEVWVVRWRDVRAEWWRENWSCFEIWETTRFYTAIIWEAFGIHAL